MIIKEGTIIGYNFDLYYASALIHEDDEIFDTEEEAREWANELIDDKIAQWVLDGAWHPEDGDNRDEFDIVINDVVDEEEDADDE